MPISGFKKGWIVRTPGGHRAVVVGVRKRGGREKVKVSYLDKVETPRTLDASTLRIIEEET